MTRWHGEGGEWPGAFARREPVEAPAVPDVLVGRSGDCGALDELVEAIRRGLSRSLVILHGVQQGPPGQAAIDRSCAASASTVSVARPMRNGVPGRLTPQDQGSAHAAAR